MSKCRSPSASATLIAIEACRACRPVTALADWALSCQWACRRFVELTYSETLLREVKRRLSVGLPGRYEDFAQRAPWRFSQFVYRPALVDRMVAAAATAETYRELLRKPAVPKADELE